jgi:REP element-mobilizing transposase RayT
MKTKKFRTSRDTPGLFITVVAKDRLPVFRTDAVKTITCHAINQARHSCEFLLLACVLMPDHLHLLTDGPRPASEVLRHVKGTVAHDVLEYLKQQGYQESLRKLRHEEWKRRHRTRHPTLEYAAVDQALEQALESRVAVSRAMLVSPVAKIPFKARDVFQVGLRRNLELGASFVCSFNAELFIPLFLISRAFCGISEDG